MKHPNEHNTPAARRRADARVRLLTRAAVLAATGATALIGVVIAKEHPGVSAASDATRSGGSSTSGTSTSTSTTSTSTTTTGSSGTSDTQATTTPTTSKPTTTTTTSHPTTTTTQPVVTSGGTSR